MYDRKIWVDETDQYENRFTETVNEDGTITHTKVTGEVYVEGTPQNAVNFNRMEDGIEDAHIAHNLFLQAYRHQNWSNDDRMTALETATVQETGTVTLMNTLDFPFNNSQATVALTNTRDNLNYVVEIIAVVSADSSPYGDIIISDRQTNGFKMAFTGSAGSATVTYAVIGGYDA